MAWHVNDYSHRQKITVDGTAGNGLSATLTNQAVLINIPATGASTSATSFWANVIDGNDVRFTSSDETTDLDFQEEAYSTDVKAVYHVEISSLGTGDTDIYMYYGKSSDTLPSTKEATWDSNYLLVNHGNQDQTEGAFDDATSNNNNLTNRGTTDRETTDASSIRLIDESRDYDGTNDDMTLAAGTLGASLSGQSAITFEFIIELDVITAQQYLIYIPIHGAAGGFVVRVQSSNFVNIFARSENGESIRQVTTSTTTLATATRYHIIATADYAGNSVGIWINDGDVDSAVNTSFTFNEATWQDGAQTLEDLFGSNGSIYLQGGGDEITVSKHARSASWRTARYQSQLGTWLTFAAQEAMPSVGGLIGNLALLGVGI